jgi:hypothetical protein
VREVGADTGPPSVRLVSGNETLEGVQGSSSWRGIARDRLLEVPDRWLPQSIGQVLRFEADGPPEHEAFLTVYPEASIVLRSMTAIAGIQLDPRKPSWRVELPPGRYVITLLRTWDSREDVVHAFGIQVLEPGLN